MSGISVKDFRVVLAVLALVRQVPVELVHLALEALAVDPSIQAGS